MEYRDPVKVASKYYRVVFENERVRVLEGRLKPKDKTAMHSHPASLAMFVTAADVRFTYPDGKAEDVSAKAGEVTWVEPITHISENIGKKDVYAFIVEFKGL